MLFFRNYGIALVRCPALLTIAWCTMGNDSLETLQCLHLGVLKRIDIFSVGRLTRASSEKAERILRVAIALLPHWTQQPFSFR